MRVLKGILTWKLVFYCVFIDAQLMILPSTLLWLVTSMDRPLVRPPSLSRVSPEYLVSDVVVWCLSYSPTRTCWLASLNTLKPDLSSSGLHYQLQEGICGFYKSLEISKKLHPIIGGHIFNSHWQLLTLNSRYFLDTKHLMVNIMSHRTNSGRAEVHCYLISVILITFLVIVKFLSLHCNWLLLIMMNSWYVCFLSCRVQGGGGVLFICVVALHR